MKRILLMLLTALACSFSFASPAQEERQNFCAANAQTAYQVMLLRDQGMDKETFENGLSELISQLEDKLSKPELEEIKHFLREAYASTGTPNGTARRIFQDCMNKKNV